MDTNPNQSDKNQIAEQEISSLADTEVKETNEVQPLENQEINFQGFGELKILPTQDQHSAYKFDLAIKFAKYITFRVGTGNPDDASTDLEISLLSLVLKGSPYRIHQIIQLLDEQSTLESNAPLMQATSIILARIDKPESMFIDLGASSNQKEFFFDIQFKDRLIVNLQLKQEKILEMIQNSTENAITSLLQDQIYLENLRSEVDLQFITFNAIEFKSPWVVVQEVAENEATENLHQQNLASSDQLQPDDYSIEDSKCGDLDQNNSANEQNASKEQTLQLQQVNPAIDQHLQSQKNQQSQSQEKSSKPTSVEKFKQLIEQSTQEERKQQYDIFLQYFHNVGGFQDMDINALAEESTMAQLQSNFNSQVPKQSNRDKSQTSRAVAVPNIIQNESSSLQSQDDQDAIQQKDQEETQINTMISQKQTQIRLPADQLKYQENEKKQQKYNEGKNTPMKFNQDNQAQVEAFIDSQDQLDVATLYKHRSQKNFFSFDKIMEEIQKLDKELSDAYEIYYDHFKHGFKDHIIKLRNTIDNSIRHGKQTVEIKPDPMPENIAHIKYNTIAVKNNDLRLKDFQPPNWKRQYEIQSDILLRNHHKDSQFLKYNWITLKLPVHTAVEVAILEEMLVSLNDVLKMETGCSTQHQTGSPYFFQGNYRLMYFPHKYLTNREQRHKVREVSFSTYQTKSPGKVFNELVVFKREKRQNYRSYYSYLDELMSCANILMDGVIYNDKKSFLAYLCCLNPMLKALVLNDILITPDNFPFVDVMNVIVFNRHLHNYEFNCIYDSEQLSSNISGELIQSIYDIICKNKETFEPILQKGSLVVEFSYTFAGFYLKQVHFAVLRTDATNTLWMQSSKTRSIIIPQIAMSGSSTCRYQFITDDLFFDKMNANRYNIDTYRVRFYTCLRQQKLSRSSLDDSPIVCHYNLRNRLVLLFSMYSLLDMPELIKGLDKESTHALNLTELFLQDFESNPDDNSKPIPRDDSESDDNEDNLEDYRDEMVLKAQEQLLDTTHGFGAQQRDADLKKSLLGRIIKYQEAILNAQEYLKMQTNCRLQNIVQQLKFPFTKDVKIEYGLPWDLCYWISNDSFYERVIYTENLLGNQSVLKYSKIGYLHRSKCPLKIEVVQKLLQQNYVNPRSKRKRRGLYSSPIIHASQKAQLLSYWNGYGYFKDDTAYLKKVTSKDKQINSRESSRTSNKSGRQSNYSAASRDSGHNDQEEEKRPDKMEDTVDEISTFEKHFFVYIEDFLTQSVVSNSDVAKISQAAQDLKDAKNKGLKNKNQRNQSRKGSKAQSFLDLIMKDSTDKGLKSIKPNSSLNSNLSPLQFIESKKYSVNNTPNLIQKNLNFSKNLQAKNNNRSHQTSVKFKHKDYECEDESDVEMHDQCVGQSRKASPDREYEDDQDSYEDDNQDQMQQIQRSRKRESKMRSKIVAKMQSTQDLKFKQGEMKQKSTSHVSKNTTPKQKDQPLKSSLKQQKDQKQSKQDYF
ncbi:UNKNOWN [Stylonychia lemnae]|uniref:Uncharacterized protein n=1 Tax=Stylonychia lemnae TaxID=5949 RepID=A0A078ASW0_STYLE|nr:UNKNOWN [Stylonychia lemnae]|eukprot:CDW85106.1 UNKNOWN [Stylonychia lemnae]